MRTALVIRRSPDSLDVDTFAGRAGMHPDLVRRLVAMGLLEATGPPNELRLPVHQLAMAARVQRLRSGLALNYASLGLVIDLLDRIAVLERALARTNQKIPPTRTAPAGGRSWT